MIVNQTYVLPQLTFGTLYDPSVLLPTPACQFTHLTCLQRQDIQAEMAQQIVIEEQLEFILRDAVMKSCMDDDTVRCVGNAKAAFCDEPLRSDLRNEEYMRKSASFNLSSPQTFRQH